MRIFLLHKRQDWHILTIAVFSIIDEKEEHEMKKVLGQVFKFGYFFGCFFTFFTNYAHAYIDPSAVTYVIQAVAGVLVALGAVFTIFRHKIFAFFKKNKKDSADNNDTIEFKDVDD